jgi:hypothetical protein
MNVRYLPKALRIPVLIGLASAGLMVTSALAAAASTAADTKPPDPPYIQADYRLNGGVGCKLAMRIILSTDDRTPQNQIRYQVLSNGVPIPGQLVLATTSPNLPPGYGWVNAVVRPAPTPQSFTLEAVDQAGNHSQPSPAGPMKWVFPGPC